MIDAAIARARAQMDAMLLRDTCEIVTPGAPTTDGGGALLPGAPTKTTEACGFAEVSGDEATADQIAVRGRYRLTLRVGAAVDATARVQYADAVYQVVWAPPPGATHLQRVVGLKDAPGMVPL